MRDLFRYDASVCAARLAGPLPSLRDWHRISMLHRMATILSMCQSISVSHIKVNSRKPRRRSSQCQKAVMATLRSASGEVAIEVLNVSKKFGNKQVRSRTDCLDL